MSRPSLVLVLVEDQRHQRFVRHFLYDKGFTRHDIRMEALPSGSGCGEQWIRERYPRAVRAYRQRSAKAKSALVVAIDADTDSTERRHRQLREVLTQDGQPERRTEEAIVQLIPKRSIETWILFLSGRNVDEDTDYCHDPTVDRVIAGAAHAFLDLSRANRSSPPSLSAAVKEAERLEGPRAGRD